MTGLIECKRVLSDVKLRLNDISIGGVVLKMKLEVGKLSCGGTFQ